MTGVTIPFQACNVRLKVNGVNLLIIMAIISFSCFSVLADTGANSDIFFRDGFDDLTNWEPLHFPEIKEHTTYSVERGRDDAYLKAESHASASALVLKKEFNVYEFPKVRWRWKISNIFEKGDAARKSGDDYPLRVYIVFEYDQNNATFTEKIKYELAKKIYGEYPFQSCLSYIWANRQQNERIITNAFASESKLVILQTGNENAGVWVDQEINIIEDYHKAFGEDPPVMGRLAIMSDSDNTKESTVSYLDYIEVYR